MWLGPTKHDQPPINKAASGCLLPSFRPGLLQFNKRFPDRLTDCCRRITERWNFHQNAATGIISDANSFQISNWIRCAACRQSWHVWLLQLNKFLLCPALLFAVVSPSIGGNIPCRPLLHFVCICLIEFPQINTSDLQAVSRNLQTVYLRRLTRQLPPLSSIYGQINLVWLFSANSAVSFFRPRPPADCQFQCIGHQKCKTN